MSDLSFSTCPVCGVEFSNGTFKWSHRKPNGDRYEATANEVYSKVCGIAQAKGRDITGCINSKGVYDETKTWVDLDTFDQLTLKNSM